MTMHLDPRHLSAHAMHHPMPQMGAADPMLPRHDARALTGGGALAAICLDGQTYTLRITRQGKLILTK